MKRYYRTTNALLALALGTAAATMAPAQILDRIVGIVDNDLILDSELNASVQFYVLNNKTDPKTPGLREQVLQTLINEKLIVAKAIEDSVTVTDEEVQQQLDQAIQARVQQFGSEARLEEMYGMPIGRIKREFRDEMRKNLLAQKLQQERFGNATIGRFEVEEFYRTYKDSLPQVPEELELSDIAIAPRFNEREKAATAATLAALLDSIKHGTDFGDLARRYSQDPGSAPQGGDLGFVRRGQFVKEFETAVFSLAEGQVSGIVETEHGLHIIQLLERRGDAVHARHILLRIQRTAASDSATVRFLDTLRTRALNGESFAELARKYSEGKESMIGGNLGTVELGQINKEFLPVLAGLRARDISAPVKIPEGSSYKFHILWVRKRTPPHPMSLEQDYQKVEAIALNLKRSKDYQAWIENLRSTIYWQARLEP
ncbi:MAG: peptidylprolyl isomerase [Bacteroidota bacterium]